jgi:hypothetical protein
MAFCCFREFMREFNSLHRLKYAQYIVRGGLKNNPRGFFKYADMKRNADGYPSSMFLGNDCAQDSQSIANLFAEFFQSVYLPTPDDSHKIFTRVQVRFHGLRRQQGTWPERNYISYFETIGFGCQSSFEFRF